jgi:hypothetical protein
MFRCWNWSDEPIFRVSENKVLRRIFRPERDEVTGGWRKFHNEELHNSHDQVQGKYGNETFFGKSERKWQIWVRVVNRSDLNYKPTVTLYVTQDCENPTLNFLLNFWYNFPRCLKMHVRKQLRKFTKPVSQDSLPRSRFKPKISQIKF